MIEDMIYLWGFSFVLCLLRMKKKKVSLVDSGVVVFLGAILTLIVAAPALAVYYALED